MVENDDFAMSLQCVKALVYYDVQACRLDIGNEKGDTALHVAARWGYQSIIETLLQNGAPTEIQNRQKETPLKCALNSKVVLSISEQLCDYFKKKKSVHRLAFLRKCMLAPELCPFALFGTSLLMGFPDG